MMGAAVPVGVALLAGIAAAYLVPPHWRAAGLPYLFGYGKNVEHAAVTAAMLTAGLVAFGLEWKRVPTGIRRALGVLAALGFGLVLAFANLRALRAALPELALSVAILAALRAGAAFERPSPAQPAPPARNLPRWVAALTLLALTAAAFVLSLRPLEIDVYHHGEVLASAVDLVQGGRPFETFLWPHGLHDTGLTALFIRLTGKTGTSPVALAQSTCRALGVLSAFALAWRISGSRGLALAAPAALVAALAAFGGEDGGPAATLHQLGVLVFVAVGFAVLLGTRGEAAAGAIFGLAYLFRIETGVYAGVAAALTLTAQEVAEAGVRPRELGRRLGLRLLKLGLGFVAVLALTRVIAGWPGVAWFTYTLQELPRYHRDSTGIPFPWPVRGLPGGDPGAVGMGLGALGFTLLLVVEAARRRAPALWCMAFFAALAARSTLERSDEAHLLQWTPLPILAAILLAVAGLGSRFAWTGRRTAAVLFSALFLLDTGRLGLADLASVLRPVDPRRAVALLREHLRPNPGVGTCDDAFFTPLEAQSGHNRRFIDATCEVEGILREHGVRRLAIQNSASWYYVRFGLPLPTRFFSLARAYTPRQQDALVADLRAHRPTALLRVRGFAGLERFEVHDALRVPVVDAYLRERRTGAPVRTTPIGDLYFWDEPEVEPRAAAAAVSAPGVGVAAERAAYQASSGLFFAEGWAADVSVPEPLRALEPRPLGGDRARRWARLEYGRPRPELSPDCGPEPAPRCGFEYVGFLAPGAFQAAQERGHLDLVAVTASGGHAPVEMPLAKTRLLPPLSEEWNELEAAVTRAAGLGRSDREQALASRGAAQP